MYSINQYIKANAQSKTGFSYWINLLKASDWITPEDIMETFSSADLLGKSCNRVVFDIGGNKYRMICHYVFGTKEIHLFINWIGSHAEYTQLCNKNRQYTESQY